MSLKQIAYNDESHILHMQKNTTAKYAILSFCWCRSNNTDLKTNDIKNFIKCYKKQKLLYNKILQIQIQNN